MASKRLTDIGFPPVPITNDDLIHVVITADTSQNSAGSSYKVKISEISSLIEGNISGDTYVTGFTYDGSNIFTISRNEGKPPLSQVFNSVSGLTVNGNLNITGTTSGNTALFNNLTASTFSAETLNLGGVSYTSIPSGGGGSFTGGTVTGSTNFTNGLTSNTFSASSITLNGVSYTSITDSFVTGFSYNNANTFTILRNQGLSALTQSINSVTGLTVNGNLNITGTTSGTTGIFNNLTATTFSAGTLSLGGVSYTSIPSGGGSFTGGTVVGQTSFSTGVTINGDLTVLGNIYGLSDVTYQGTGLTVHFSAKTIFNLPTSPANGNISGDTTNAKFGMIQKIYHSGSTEPTFQSSWKLVGDGIYFPNELNIIYAEYVTNSWIEYWIIQQQ